MLVKPDSNDNAPEILPSGIVISKTMAAAVTGIDPTSSVHRGTVVGVGRPKHPLWWEASTLAQKLTNYHAAAGPYGDTLIHDAAEMLHDLVRRVPVVSLGDDVLFAHDVGQDVDIEGERHILLHEADLLAIVDPV